MFYVCVYMKWLIAHTVFIGNDANSELGGFGCCDSCVCVYNSCGCIRLFYEAALILYNNSFFLHSTKMLPT